MCDIGVPEHVIKLMMTWYSNITMIVKWDGSYSNSCSVKCGVRQCGVLLPLVFNVYLNVLVKSLEISSLGCHLHGEYIGCLVCADGIILLSASVVNLQRMFDVCHTVGATVDISFNAAKSTLFTVAKFCDNTINNLQIGNARIHWCKSLKYLGIYFQSNRSLKCNTDLSVHRFYTATKNTRYASELSKLF